MVSRGKAIKTVIAGGVGVAVVGLSVDAAWPASWLDTTPPTPNITQSSAPVSPGVLAPVKAATPTPSPAVSKVAMPTGVLLSKPLNGPVTSPFGMRFHPILHVWTLHTGVDFGASCGTPVGSSAPGKVLFAGPAGGYGNRVEVDHGMIAGKHVSTTYNHLSVIGVRVGQRVDVHQAVALSGTTGYSTGCHLHYEVVVNGQFTDPLPWLNGKPAVVNLDKLKPVRGATIPAGELHHPDPVPPTPHPSGTPSRPTTSNSPSKPGSTSVRPSGKPSAPTPSSVSTTTPGKAPSTSPSRPGPTTEPAPGQPTSSQKSLSVTSTSNDPGH